MWPSLTPRGAKPPSARSPKAASTSRRTRAARRVRPVSSSRSRPGATSASTTQCRAALVRRDVEAAFGDLALGGFAPRGVRDGHIEGSAHYEGRAIDIFVRPISAGNRQRGWAIAQYLVAQADRLDIRTLIFDDRIWTAGDRSGSGWRDYDAPDGPGDRAVLEHRDHVHVDVFA